MPWILPAKISTNHEHMNQSKQMRDGEKLDGEDMEATVRDNSA